VVVVYDNDYKIAVHSVVDAVITSLLSLLNRLVVDVIAVVALGEDKIMAAVLDHIFHKMNTQRINPMKLFRFDQLRTQRDYTRCQPCTAN